MIAMLQVLPPPGFAQTTYDSLSGPFAPHHDSLGHDTTAQQQRPPLDPLNMSAHSNSLHAIWGSGHDTGLQR